MVAQVQLPFEPLQDFVLIEPMRIRETEGGIALPDQGVQSGGSQPNKGRVVKVGPGRETDDGTILPPKVAPGDVVYLYFAYEDPVTITLKGVTYLIVRSREIIAKAE